MDDTNNNDAPVEQVEEQAPAPEGNGSAALAESGATTRVADQPDASVTSTRAEGDDAGLGSQASEEPFDHGYHDSAMRTAAGPDVFHPQIGGNAQQLAHDLVAYIAAARVMDGWKSRLFYGKHKVVSGADLHALARQTADYGNLPNPQLIHGILGIASEGGEIAEDLLRLLVGGDHINDNIEREQGDIDWFQELVAEARGVSVSECRFRNILRLRERFPDAFSEEDAVARADEA